MQGKILPKYIFGPALAISMLCLPGFAQDSATSPLPSAPSGGWRRFGDSSPATPQVAPVYQDPQNAAPDSGAQGVPAPPPPNDQGQPGAPADAVPQSAPAAPSQPAYQAPPASYSPLPAQLTIPAGNWITVRVNQPISSDRNQVGDLFTGTLVQPIVVNGRIVARRGQTVAGRVVEALKAGTVNGVSRLGVQITGLTLVDGRQVPIQTQLVERKGPTSVGRDAAAIGTTTGIGAAIGAGAAGGVGAGIGAIAGAAASTIGVLVTRGRPTVIYPEAVLTFSLTAPIVIDNVTDAFVPVTQQDYNPAPQQRFAGPGGPARAPAPYAAGYPYSYPYAYPYPYPYYYGPYVYGPSVYFGGPAIIFRGRRW